MSVASCYLWILCAATLGFSTALMNITAVLAATTSLISMKRASLVEAIRHPLVLASTLLFIWLSVTLLWTVAAPNDALAALRKYAKLLYVPLIFTAFITCPRIPAERMLFAFATTTVALGVLSLLLSFGPSSLGLTLSQSLPVHIGSPDDPTVARSYISQGTYLVLTAGLLAWYLANSSRASLNKKTTLMLLIVLCVFVSLWLFRGYTAFLVLASGLLSVFLAAIILGNKKALLVTLSSAVIAAGTLAAFPPRVLEKGHLHVAVSQHLKSKTLSSVGIRVTQWEAGLSALADAPIIGHGAGSYATVFPRYNTFPELNWHQSQPHSEYVSLAVQGGIVALSIWIFLIIKALQKGLRLASAVNPQDGMLVTFLIGAYAGGALVNPFVWDSAQGVLGMILIATIALLTRDDQ